MASLTKHKDKDGNIHYRLRWYDPRLTGQQGRYLRCSLKMAESEKARIEEEIEILKNIGTKKKHNYVPDHRRPTTLNELLDLVLKWKIQDTGRVGQNISPLTEKRYRVAVKSFTNYITDDEIYLNEIDYYFIENKYLLPRAKGGTSKNTLNTDITHMKALFSTAVKIGLIDTNPFEKIPKFITEKKEARIIQPDEWDRIFKVCPQRWYPLLMLYMLTGARRTELLKPKLKWENIDFEKMLITLPERKRKKKSIIPLSPKMAEILMELKANPMPKANHVDKTDVIYPFPFSPTFISRVFKNEIFKKACVNVTLHGLRRSFGSYLLNLGYSMYDVSEMLSHSSIKVTENHYAGQIIDAKRDMIKNLENKVFLA